LKFSLYALLTNKNTFLTFDIFGLPKHIPLSTGPFTYVIGT